MAIHRDIEVCNDEETRRRRHHARATRAVSIVGATYVGLRLAIAAFHRTRRCHLRRLLREVSVALKDNGTTFWLDFGSLLGIHRDGDLILHDNDIDFAVLDPDWPPLLEELKQRLPQYSVKIVTPNDAPGSSWIRVYCPLGMADLFGAYSTDNGKVHVDCGHGDVMHINKDLVLPTSIKHWNGMDLPVPADLEGTLRRRYGEGWGAPAYLDKGADDVENSKPYARLFRALAKVGIKF